MVSHCSSQREGGKVVPEDADCSGSCYHQLRVFDQFATGFELGKEQALLGFVRKGHVLGSRELGYSVAPSAGYSHGKRAVCVKNKFVGRIPHRSSVLNIE